MTIMIGTIGAFICIVCIWALLFNYKHKEDKGGNKNE